MFGTDGVRGTPGTHPLDERTVTRIGAATAHVLPPEHPRLLVGRDTRESGPWIERHLGHGVVGAGGALVSVGVMPTPAVAFLTATRGFDAGVVVSASHNPFPDNGIKIVTADGEKAPVALEERIEALVADAFWNPPTAATVTAETLDLSDAYVAHVCRVMDGAPRTGLRLAVDCANGATSRVAPRALQALGFEVTTINTAPDGHKINAGCGSTHPKPLQDLVTARGYDLGLAFDGDGDRVVMVDHDGTVIDGDAVLFICAKHLKAAGRLPGNGVVATVMSNIGLEIGLRAAGIALHRCAVGDRHVRETMIARGLALGGEQSGHVIFADLLPTGDGLVTALSVIRVMTDTAQPLASLTSELETYPQVLVNVPVRATPPLDTLPDVEEAIRTAESDLAGGGRVLVRYSGTEPLLRVMIEGRDSLVVQRLAASIAERVRARLG